MFRTVDGRFTVVDVMFENSGGGCMVLVVSVYDDSCNQMRYVLYNEEGGCLTTVDYVFSEIDYHDKMVIASFNEEDHEAYYSGTDGLTDGETNELFEYCWQEFIKRYCKHWKTTMCSNYEVIPHALRNQMPAGYTAWLKENGQLIETDGERIIVDDRFKPSAKEKPQEQADLEELLEHLNITYSSDTDEDWEKFYEQKITIGFGNRMAVISNTATAYNELCRMIKEILDEDYGC